MLLVLPQNSEITDLWTDTPRPAWEAAYNVYRRGTRPCEGCITVQTIVWCCFVTLHTMNQTWGWCFSQLALSNLSENTKEGWLEMLIKGKCPRIKGKRQTVGERRRVRPPPTTRRQHVEQGSHYKRARFWRLLTAVRQPLTLHFIV